MHQFCYYEHQELLVQNSDLLSVVNRMGDDLEMNDPGLSKAVDKLKNMRKNADEPEKLGLFVEKGNGF